MPVRIFLSAVSDEFSEYREVLRRHLTSLDVEVKIQEDFKELGVVTLVKLDRYIAECDAVVHLVGDMTGASPLPISVEALRAEYPDLGTGLAPLAEALDVNVDISYTQWEAWLALLHGKRLVIAQPAPTAPRGPHFARSDASWAAQQTHLARLRVLDRYPGVTFTSADNLAAQVLGGAILDLLRDESRDDATTQASVAVGTLAAAGLFALLLAVAWHVFAEPLSRSIGWPLTALLLVVLVILAVAFAIGTARYVEILGLGAARIGSPERKAYEKRRGDLAGGGLVAREYSRRLTAFLDRVDHFFGDAGMAHRTLFPHAFGLKSRASLWTAQSLDRCLLLAFIYPIAIMFVIWGISGQVGAAEESLQLTPNVTVWKRSLALCLTSLLIIVGWNALRLYPWNILAISIMLFIYLIGMNYATGSGVATVAISFSALIAGIAGGFAAREGSSFPALGLLSVTCAFTSAVGSAVGASFWQAYDNILLGALIFLSIMACSTSVTYLVTSRALRVCPERSCWIAELSEHEAD